MYFVIVFYELNLGRTMASCFFFLKMLMSWWNNELDNSFIVFFEVNIIKNDFISNFFDINIRLFSLFN